MFGALLNLFQKSKPSLVNLAKSISYNHKEILTQITFEARLLGVLGHPNDSEELGRYYQSLADRYNEVLSNLHQQARTHQILLGMRQLAKGVSSQTNPRLIKRLRYRFLEYFEYVDEIKKLEQKIVAEYIEAIEVFQTKNLKFLSPDEIGEYFYQPPPPLNTIFSGL